MVMVLRQMTPRMARWKATETTTFCSVRHARCTGWGSRSRLGTFGSRFGPLSQALKAATLVFTTSPTELISSPTLSSWRSNLRSPRCSSPAFLSASSSASCSSICSELWLRVMIITDVNSCMT